MGGYSVCASEALASDVHAAEACASEACVAEACFSEVYASEAWVSGLGINSMCRILMPHCMSTARQVCSIMAFEGI